MMMEGMHGSEVEDGIEANLKHGGVGLASYVSGIDSICA